MKSQKGGVRLWVSIFCIILIIIMIMCFKQYKKNYFNGFEKATAKHGEETVFIRDSDVKYSEENSYKIENLEFNDATIYREVEVEPNTPYKISCMVKTENVKCEVASEEGGVVIGLLDTTEYSEPITGTNDWQKVEFMFNSKDRKTVKISFRLGGNSNECKGTVWFSDMKLEQGISTPRKTWNMGCFIIKNLDVDINGKEYELSVTEDDIEDVKINLENFKEKCSEYSEDRMIVDYEIIEIDKPVTSISYSTEHGYYLSYRDVKDYVYDIAKKREYDHIFVVCRMEEGTNSIPILNNWIGLGSMDIYGIGYSLIRLNNNSDNYKFGYTNQKPEEVYLHEFCHTLERNALDWGYDVPALHDNEKYGYKSDSEEGLEPWYRDYMRKEIVDKTSGGHVGLCEFCYSTQPPNNSDFEYTIEVELAEEPDNIFEEILTMIDVLTKKK